MVHNRRLNNCINNVHEHALRIVYRDCNKSFRELLKLDKYVSIYKEKPTNTCNRNLPNKGWYKSRNKESNFHL